jgi:hypothetical protein
MFKGCTSLTTAPELPGTNGPTWCYAYMFENCTSLTSAPLIASASLGDYSFGFMFSDCISLSYVKCLTIDHSADRCTYGMFSGVGRNGTFVKDPNAVWYNYNQGGPIPVGWTIVDAV